MIRLAVRCSPQLAERVLAELVEIVPGGVEEEHGDGYVEYAIYGPPGELPELPDLEAAAGDGLVAIETTEIPDDWADRWRDFHEPIAIGEPPGIVVRPSWEPATAPSGAIDVVIDPGRAFGTGAHPTTRMCLELLLELAGQAPERGSLADLGTGSGVLAIAAAKLGFAQVVGYDHEPAALEAARTNAELNGVEVRLERLNLRDELPPPASTWLCNLTAPALLAIAGGLSRRQGLEPRGMIVSGLPGREAKEVGERFIAAGFRIAKAHELSEWAALLLVR